MFLSPVLIKLSVHITVDMSLITVLCLGKIYFTMQVVGSVNEREKMSTPWNKLSTKRGSVNSRPIYKRNIFLYFTQIFQKLIYLRLFADCFTKISLLYALTAPFRLKITVYKVCG